jgi:hypothetical protein
MEKDSKKAQINLIDGLIDIQSIYFNEDRSVDTGDLIDLAEMVEKLIQDNKYYKG